MNSPQVLSHPLDLKTTYVPWVEFDVYNYENYYDCSEVYNCELT